MATTTKTPTKFRLLIFSVYLIGLLLFVDVPITLLVWAFSPIPRRLPSFVTLIPESSSSSQSLSKSTRPWSTTSSIITLKMNIQNADDNNDSPISSNHHHQQQQEQQQSTKPLIVIVGSGAVGGYYGSRLWECDKYDVHFHMRNNSDHLQSCQQHGLHVQSIHGNIHIPPTELQIFTDPTTFRTTNLMTNTKRIVDWVIVALKSSSLDEIPALIYPLLEPGKTRVLCIMNGLIEEDLIRSLKLYAGEITMDDDNGGSGPSPESISCCKAIYGGMALICSNRIEPGKIDHSYAGLLSAGIAAQCRSTTSSSKNSNDDDHDDFDDEARNDFEALFAPTTVSTTYEPSILAGRWRKCVWNIPFNGISVSMGGLTVDKIVSDNGLRQLAYDLMDETIAAANADLAFHGLVGQDFLIGEEDKIKMMSLSDNMGEYRTSTMLDFVNGRPMETKFLLRKPMERAQALGVKVPKIETIVAMIEALDQLRSTPIAAGQPRIDKAAASTTDNKTPVQTS